MKKNMDALRLKDIQQLCIWGDVKNRRNTGDFGSALTDSLKDKRPVSLSDSLRYVCNAIYEDVCKQSGAKTHAIAGGHPLEKIRVGSATIDDIAIFAARMQVSYLEIITLTGDLFHYANVGTLRDK